MKRLLAFFGIVSVLSVDAVTMEAVQNAIATTESNKDFVLPSDSRFQRKWQNFCAAVSDGQPHVANLAYVLIDCTISGVADDGLLVDNLGLSVHNFALYGASNGFMSWFDFAEKGVIKEAGPFEVVICENPRISICTSGSSFKNEQMIQFLSKLLAAARMNPMSKEDELLAAINKRDCAAAREIIGRGFGSLNCELTGHWTPMSRAAALNHVEMLRLLREFGATPDYVLNGYWNNLQSACGNKAYDAVRYFVEECKLPIGDCLITAAQNGDMWLVKYFVGECNADGHSALIEAKKKNQQEVVAFLGPLVAMAEEQVEAAFQSRLMNSIISNDAAEIVKLLLDCNFNLNFETKVGNCTWTPLTKAAELGNVELAKVLVNAGAKADFVDSARNTPLYQAAWSGRLDMVKFLSRYSTDLGCAALFAAKAGRLEVLKWMIEEKGLSQDYVNDDKTKTITGVLLAEAAFCGKVDVCKYLVAKGATVDFKPKSSRGWSYYSALEMAAQNGQMEVVRYLVEEKSAKLFDALDLARKNKHEQVVKYLERHYAAELKARKEAAEVAERKKIEAEKRRREELAARKEKEDRVLSEYRKLTSSLGWFSGEHGYSEGAEKWARGLVKGLNVINQKHFDESVKSAFRIMAAKADVLLTEVRNEQDMRREISEAKVKLQDQISQNGADALGNMWAAGSQGLCGGKREALSGLMNYFGALSQGVNNEKKLKNALAELERLEEHSHDKVSRAYADYKDAAEIFEKRALRQVNE